MNQDEFYDFIIDHTSRFPFVGDLFKTNPDDENKTAERVKRSWFASLKKIPYPAAVDASNLMFANEKFQPKYKEQHLAAIMSLANKAKSAANVGNPEGLKPPMLWATNPETGAQEPAYRCPRCRDVGIVVCWGKDAVHDQHAETFTLLSRGNHGRTWQEARYCDCAYGRSIGPKHAGRFVQGKHFPVGWNDDESRKTLAEATKAQRPAEDDPFE